MPSPDKFTWAFPLFSALTILVLLFAAWDSIRPSHDRSWRVEQSKMPLISWLAEEDGKTDEFRVHNLRDFRYDENGVPIQTEYRTETYSLSDLDQIWFLVVPFSEDGWRGPAHAFFSFEFNDGRHLAVSVEARREEGEEYSTWKGMLKRYELMYVLGTEEDLIGLRTNVWKDPTYLYPVNATPEGEKELLRGLLERARHLEQNPEFYHTIGNNCTTNLVDEINRIAPVDKRIPFGKSVLLPGYSDELALKMGLLDTEKSLEEARAHFRVNSKVADAYGAPNFSEMLRAGL